LPAKRLAADRRIPDQLSEARSAPTKLSGARVGLPRMR
jgi:hypothetical protein